MRYETFNRNIVTSIHTYFVSCQAILELEAGGNVLQTIGRMKSLLAPHLVCDGEWYVDRHQGFSQLSTTHLTLFSAPPKAKNRSRIQVPPGASTFLAVDFIQASTTLNLRLSPLQCRILLRRLLCSLPSS